MRQNLMHKRLLPAAFAMLLGVPAAHAAADSAKGQKLHDQQCIECHKSVVGNDANKIYTRPNRIIKSRTALAQRVTFCAAQANAKWLPEDEENVAAYLNEKFYKFK